MKRASENEKKKKIIITIAIKIIIITRHSNLVLREIEHRRSGDVVRSHSWWYTMFTVPCRRL